MADYKAILARLDNMTQTLMKVDQMNETLLEVQADVKSCNENFENSIVPRLNALENDVKNVKVEVTKLKEKNLKLESYLRRGNLLFGGITETEPEDCETQVKFVIRTTLKIDPSGMKFHEIYRLGQKQPGRTRPIYVRFLLYADRQSVWKKRGDFRNSTFWVSEDFPAEIKENRRVLYPILKKAKVLHPKDAYMVADKLHIAKKVYSVNDLESLPIELKPENVATPHVGEGLVAFYNRASPLSNFYPARFQIGRQSFHHVEQYFQFKKAEISGDLELAGRIASEKCPVQCKNLGKKAKINEEWNTNQENVMREGCRAKFEQNEEEMQFLLRTGEKVIVEARSDDVVWGAGLKHDDPKLLNPSNEWPGQNKLGIVLMSIRDNQ